MKYLKYLILLFAVIDVHAAESLVFGTWVLNNEATYDAQPIDKKKSGWFSKGKMSTSVSVGGIPIPTSNSRPPPPSGAARDPKVLRCSTLSIVREDNYAVMTFDEDEQERLRDGNKQGTKTSWSKKKLSSIYETTFRTVLKRFEIRKDGKLEATVVIKPKHGKKIKYKRIFDRVS